MEEITATEGVCTCLRVRVRPEVVWRGLRHFAKYD